MVVATIGDRAHQARGECVPYTRYGESVEGVVQAIEACGPAIAQGLDRAGLQDLLPAGAARNALDCALWDLEAKRSGRSAAELAGLAPLHAVETAFTISLGPPEEMAARARDAASYPLLKLKLGGDGDEERLAAVRQAVPNARLIADANEAWRASNLERLLAAAKAAGVELIEQPLPAGDDALLEHIDRIVPLCADESVHDRASLATIARRYDAVNIKLDKTGGLTEALATAAEARSSDSRSWWGAWWQRRSPWPLPCCSQKTPTSSISTGLCCSSATACRVSPTAPAWSCRHRQRSGAEPGWGRPRARRASAA